MINPEVLIGAPLHLFKGISVYPPTVYQVITNPRYGQFVRLLTISQEDIMDEMAKKEIYTDLPSPFEFLFINCYHYPEFLEIAKLAFEFFLHEKVNFFYEQKLIVIGDLATEVQQINQLEDLRTIKEEEYFELQNKIREAIGEKVLKKPEPPNPNEDPRIARIKAKARERDRIKARKGTANGISFVTSLTAICCMGIGITPLNIGEMSYASIQPIMRMLQNKEKYEVDVQSLLAGADSKKVKPKYWIRNLDEK